MERFLKNRFFAFLVYAFLISLLLYMLVLISPVIAGVFSFLKVVLAPFFIALVISYILNPVVNSLNRRKVPRTVAVLLIYTIFVVSLIVILMNLTPVFMRQLKELNEHMPELAAKAEHLFAAVYDNQTLPEAVKSGIQKSLNRLEDTISLWIANMVNGIGTTINLLFVAFIVPFLAFYMMKDFKLIERSVLTFVPKSYRRQVVRLVVSIDKALGNYIRGQLIVCLLVGLSAYIGYWLVGLPYPLLLASLVGLFNIIPYVGPFFGIAPALVVASTISVKMMLLVIVVNVAVQILEGNVIGPQVVGRTLHMHPLLIIFALIIGGELAGIVGLILAVPVFAVLKVIVQHFAVYYMRHNRVK